MLWILPMPPQQALHFRTSRGKCRGAIPPVNHKNFIRINFRHYFDRVSSDNGLIMTFSQQTDQAALQVCVHVNVGFVENNRGRLTTMSEKPHGLEPHLKSMSHRTNLGRKIAITDKE